MAEPSAPEVDLGLFVSQIRGRAVICLDPSGIVLTWNEGAREIKGYDAADIVGRNFEVFYREVDRLANLPTSLLAVAARDGVTRHVGARVRADGTTFWGEVVISAVHGAHGELLGFVKVTGDLSSLRTGANDARATLRTATRDARNPLAAAAGLAELLEGAPLDAAAEGLVARLRTRLDEIDHALQALDGSIAIGPSGTTIEAAQSDPIEVARRAAASAREEGDRVTIAADGYAAGIPRADLERILTTLVHGLLAHDPATAIAIECSAVAGIVRVTIDAHPASIEGVDRLMHDAPGGGVGTAQADGGVSVATLLERFDAGFRVEEPSPARVVITLGLPTPQHSA